MSDEARLVTQEELLSILENIQQEVITGKVKSLQIVLQNVISIGAPSRHITTANLIGKQLTINLSYED